MTELVKINFRLKQDADGYPPAAVESLWARSVDDGLQLDNIPFFTSEATFGDVVLAVPDNAGALWFERVMRRSRHSLVRVVMFRPELELAVVDQLKSIGCCVERMPNFKLLAIDIDSSDKLKEVQQYLHAAADAGSLDFEEPILRT